MVPKCRCAATRGSTQRGGGSLPEAFTHTEPYFLSPSTPQVSHPGLLKISGLQQGEYTFQMTVTDTGGQKSSDNVSVTVLAPERLAEGDSS